MSNADVITVRGAIGTDPELKSLPSGQQVLEFRMVTHRRRFDDALKQWRDANSNWYRVAAWRGLAQNAAASLAKGDRVIVQGVLTLEDYQRKDGTTGFALKLDADSIGHDLVFTRTRSTRAELASPATSAGPDAEADPAPDSGEWAPRAEELEAIPF